MPQSKHFIVILLISFLALSPCACSSDENDRSQVANPETANHTIVVYVSADDFLARQIISTFERESGIEVAMVGDSEINKTTGLANRIIAERNNPQADVFWSSECFMMIQLAKEGVLSPVEAALPEHWPQHLIDNDRLWHGFAPRARVIVYSPDRIAADELPTRWMDLSNAKWKNRIVMADPRFGTTRGHMGAMQHWWETNPDSGNFEEFLNGLKANDARMLTTGNAGVVDAVARGEADIGFTDTDDVWAAQRNGANVKLIYPAHGDANALGEGTLVIPNTIALIKGAANPDGAKLFINFMLSERVERMLVESDSHNIPLRANVVEEYPQYAVPSPLEIDLSQAADAMDEAVEKVMQKLDK